MNRKQARTIKKDQGNPAAYFLRVYNNTMPGFLKAVDRFADPRHQSYITYPQRVMIGTMLLKNACGILSMNQMPQKFNDDAYIKNISLICELPEELEEIPHFVTINNYLSCLDPKYLEQVQIDMVKRLIRGRAYEDARFDKKWIVIVDATGICSFDEENDEKCLHRTYNRGSENEYTVWSHSVLEAKIYLGEHLVVSIGSEYIENNAEDADRQEKMGAERVKQDCELKAFKRLAEKIKWKFPHLPICILGDSLYATETVFGICEKYGWDYIIRLKDGAMPGVSEEFHMLKDRDKENCYKDRKWINQIDFHNRSINVVEWKDKDKTFQWVTNKLIHKDMVVKLTGTGRKRWKIENEGFNNQKNHRFAMGHVCSHNYTAIKNHYMLIQIVDTLRQIYELKAYENKGLQVNIKNISSDLLAHFGRILTREDIFHSQQQGMNALC